MYTLYYIYIYLLCVCNYVCISYINPILSIYCIQISSYILYPYLSFKVHGLLEMASHLVGQVGTPRSVPVRTLAARRVPRKTDCRLYIPSCVHNDGWIWLVYSHYIPIKMPCKKKKTAATPRFLDDKNQGKTSRSPLQPIY